MSNALVYAVEPTELDLGTGMRTGGDLLWYRHDGREDGSFRWTGPTRVGTGWDFEQVFSGEGGVVYALRENGDLLWYRHDGREDGGPGWTGPRRVAEGWRFEQVFSGGGGVVYAVEPTELDVRTGVRTGGGLLWYRHDGRQDGTPRWTGPRRVGSGWRFRQVFSGGDGVVYALRENGDLLWYRHDGREDGSPGWTGPRRVAEGWQFEQVFSGGGVVYAVEPTELDVRTGARTGGGLLWFRHDGRQDGTPRWTGPRRAGSGWRFRQLFSGGDELLAAVGSTRVEGTSKIEHGIIFVSTDNPQVETTTRLVQVHAEWNNGMVAQEISSQGNGWRFENGDIRFVVRNAEAEAGNGPVRAGSVNDDVYAWPGIGGQWSANGSAEVTLRTRIRVGYEPVTVQLAVSLPKGGLAPNHSDTVRIALDPEILLVPVEVVRFFSRNFPLPDVTAIDQMALWDQMPVIGATTNFTSVDGGTGETRFVERAWDYWPTLSPDGLYTHNGWVSPDSVWGKAGVRFRLVNFFDVETDDDHAAANGGLADDSRLYENSLSLAVDPRHIGDKKVVTVIVMVRAVSRNAPEVGRALIGRGTVGLSWAAEERFAVLAHEIGHLISGTGGHSDLPNNVMNDPGPGTDITPEQASRARIWASGYQAFWQRPG